MDAEQALTDILPDLHTQNAVTSLCYFRVIEITRTAEICDIVVVVGGQSWERTDIRDDCRWNTELLSWTGSSCCSAASR